MCAAAASELRDGCAPDVARAGLSEVARAGEVGGASQVPRAGGASDVARAGLPPSSCAAWGLRTGGVGSPPPPAESCGAGGGESSHIISLVVGPAEPAAARSGDPPPPSTPVAPPRLGSELAPTCVGELVGWRAGGRYPLYLVTASMMRSPVHLSTISSPSVERRRVLREGGVSKHTPSRGRLYSYLNHLVNMTHSHHTP